MIEDTLPYCAIGHPGTSFSAKAIPLPPLVEMKCPCASPVCESLSAPVAANASRADERVYAGTLIWARYELMSSTQCCRRSVDEPPASSVVTVPPPPLPVLVVVVPPPPPPDEEPEVPVSPEVTVPPGPSEGRR